MKNSLIYPRVKTDINISTINIIHFHEEKKLLGITLLKSKTIK